jgi:hypothetical protein
MRAFGSCDVVESVKPNGGRKRVPGLAARSVNQTARQHPDAQRCAISLFRLWSVETCIALASQSPPSFFFEVSRKLGIGMKRVGKGSPKLAVHLIAPTELRHVLALIRVDVNVELRSEKGRGGEGVDESGAPFLEFVARFFVTNDTSKMHPLSSPVPHACTCASTPRVAA